jgi:hypothetical protein
MGITITPDVWGPVGWKFIHFIALAYPQNPTDEQKLHYKTFFESIHNVLPCIICSNNYKKHLEELPLNDETLKNKEALLRWSIDMHNKVNRENNKPVLSYEDAINLMLNNFNNNDDDNNLNNIQNNELNSNKSKDTKNNIFKKPSNIDFDEYDKSGSNVLFFTFAFWFVIAAILITIAIVYKKN